jgi:hypothetical protein
MSTIRNPVGPQPKNVYWRRRLFVIIVALAVLLIIILILVRPGSGHEKPTGLQTPSTKPSTSASSAPIVACKPASITLAAITDAGSYAANVNPKLSLSLTNNGPVACTMQAGSDVQNYSITSGTEKIWESKDCQKKPVPTTVTLEPGKSVTSTPFAWDRTRSSTTTCTKTNKPKVIAGGASYHLSVTVGSLTSAKSKQFVLK